jgi:hypothetical protein
LASLKIKFSVIVLSETKLDDSCNNLYIIDGYQHFSINRNRQGGGIRLYYLNNLVVNVFQNFTGIFDTCELLTASVFHGDSKLINIVCIYRPPSSSKKLFTDFVGEILMNNAFNSSDTMLIGDFNVDLACSTAANRKFFDKLSSNSFKLLITLPTYVPPNYLFPTSTIDHIAIRSCKPSDSMIFDVKVADHLPVACFIDIDYNRSQLLHDVTFRNFNNRCIQHFFNDIDNIFVNMPNDFQSLSVNAASDLFTNWCIKVANKYFPICNKRIGNKRIQAPWLCKSAMKCIHFKNQLFKRCKGNDKWWELYYIIDEILNRLIEMARIEYYRNFFSANKKSSKKTWGKINNLISGGKNRYSKQHIDDGGVIIAEPLMIANKFNHYFLNISTELHNNISPAFGNYFHLIPINQHSIFFAPATSSEVFTVIHSIKSNSSIQDIPIKMLKLSPNFAVGIAELFNHIIVKGEYPDKLKLATVIPIHKSGSRSNIKNFRPISLLPVLDKIFEKLIYNRLTSFLYSNNIITDRQFGFLNGSNTVLSIMDILSTLIPALRNKEFAVAIFADLSRAFDCVVPELLLRKLSSYGIRGVALSLFRSFLSDRYQRVLIDSVLSDPGKVKLGVPQGSTLGPILFLLYINELPLVLRDHVKCILYADDTTLVLRGSNDETASQILCSVMSTFADWLKYNKLLLNINKTKVVYFSLRTSLQKPLIYVDQSAIEYVDHHKYLGITLDSKVNYNVHINQVKGRLSMLFGISTKVSQFFNLTAAKNFYYSHVYATISYGIIIWGGWLDLAKYNSLSKKHLKIIKNIFYRFATPYTCDYCILKKLKLLKLRDIYNIQILCFMFMSQSNNNTKISNYIDKVPNRLYHNLRKVNEFVLPQYRINQEKYNYQYQCLALWNELPVEIKRAESIRCFKKMYIDYKIDHYCSH